MRLGLTIFVIVILAVVLTGCGGDHFQVKDEKIGHGYSVVRVPYKGRQIDCIMRTTGVSGNGVSGTIRSISCDFDAFHQVSP